LKGRGNFLDFLSTVFPQHGTKATIRELDINELTFSSVKVDLGDKFFMEDETIDWDDISKNFKEI
jgi:hypothetical protein